jgi:hypothetical protein
MWIFLFRVNYEAGVALHEAGHALRGNAFGLDYLFLTSASDVDINNGVRNIAVYYFQRMTFQCGRGGACAFIDEKKYENISCNQNIIICAGGLNNQMLLSENIGYDMYIKKQCNSLPWFLYFYEKIHSAEYDFIAEDDKLSHDPTAIIKSFNEKGRKDFQKGTIATASLTSIFLSATTYSIFTGKPICLANIRLPDLYAYITTKGMSYKLVSGYRVNEDTILNFGCERVFGKECAIEMFIGIDRTSLPVHYKCTATFGLGLDIEGSIIVPLSSWLFVGIGCEYYHFSSLQGQRNITRNILNVNETSTDIFTVVSCRY